MASHTTTEDNEPQEETKALRLKRAKDIRSNKSRRAKTLALQAELAVLRPLLTAERAGEFVKIVSAGVPPLEAFRFHLKLDSIPPQIQQIWLDVWLADPLLTEAANAWNHGAWEDLPEERRVEVALAHATNQMAHFLYTHAFHEVVGAEMTKWMSARGTLQALVEAKSGAGQSAYDKFLAQVLANTAQAGPPQLGTTSAHHERIVES